MFLCFSFTALFIKDPGPEQNLIEGASLKLQYDLRESRFKLNFFKDGMYLAETAYVVENIFRKEKVTMNDQGYYFAEVNSIKSNITKVTVDGRILYISWKQPLCCKTSKHIHKKTIRIKSYQTF